ncbi:MAG: hypothetical protein ACREU3_02920 [Steroidobacteraceae bacterium]
MLKVTYEVKNIYDIDGLRITSRVVSDDIRHHPEPMRVIRVETYCDSERWGTRSRQHTSSVPVDFHCESQLDDTRRREAQILADIEHGKRSEENPGFLGVKLHGAPGICINAAASVNLASGPTLMSGEFIELLKLEESGQRYGEWTPRGVREFPLYKLTIEFGKHRIETVVVPAVARSMATCVIGGDFFAKALAGSPKLLYGVTLAI